MKFVADTHTHTLASGHALSTVYENVLTAKELGFSFLAVTDHATAMEGAPKPVYFDALPNVMPHSYHGVYLLSGCEANIINAEGELDLSHNILNKLDIVIASMHTIVFKPISKEAHTAAWLKICDNPDVDILGHIGDQRYEIDKETVVRRCKEMGKVIEINSHSFSARPGSSVNCREVALLCMKYRLPIVVSSDSHFLTSIGEFADAQSLLESVGFPEELVLNADYDRFAAFLKEKTGRDFPRF